MTWQAKPGPGEIPEPSRIDRSLHAVTRRLGLPTPPVLRELFGSWEALVGRSIAEHVRPLVIEGSTLVLTTTEPGWVSQIRFLETDLVAQLNARVPDSAIDSIVVRVRGNGARVNPAMRSGRRRDTEADKGPEAPTADPK